MFLLTDQITSWRKCSFTNVVDVSQVSGLKELDTYQERYLNAQLRIYESGYHKPNNLNFLEYIGMYVFIVIQNSSITLVSLFIYVAYVSVQKYQVKVKLIQVEQMWVWQGRFYLSKGIPCPLVWYD